MIDDIRSCVIKFYIIMLVTLCFFIHNKQENGTAEGSDINLKTEERKSLRGKDASYFVSHVLIKNYKRDNRSIRQTDHDGSLSLQTDIIQDVKTSLCKKSGNGNGFKQTSGYCKFPATKKMYSVQSIRTPHINLSKNYTISETNNLRDNISGHNGIHKNISLYQKRFRYFKFTRKRKTNVVSNSEFLTKDTANLSRSNRLLNINKIYNSDKNNLDPETSQYILYNLASNKTNDRSGTLKAASTKRYRRSVDRVTEESTVENINNNTFFGSAKRSETKGIHSRNKTTSINNLRKILEQKLGTENEDYKNSTESYKDLNNSLNKIVERKKYLIDRKLNSNSNMSSAPLDVIDFDKNSDDRRSDGNDFVALEDALIINNGDGPDMINVAKTVQDPDRVTDPLLVKDSINADIKRNVTLNAFYVVNRKRLSSQSAPTAELQTQQDSNSDLHLSLRQPAATATPDKESTTTIVQQPVNPASSVEFRINNHSNDTTSDEYSLRSSQRSDDIQSYTTVKTLTSKNGKQQRQSLTGNKEHVTWPVKLSAEVAGDLILGGLMMVHEREDTITCGPIMPQGGIQALETMLYTLDVINSQPGAPFTIGAHILDDCDKDTYGLEMAVDFIKGSISNIDGAEYHCNKTQVRKVISGVVGAASSVTSIQVANLLRLFRIPQVSFFSTSPELSNKQRFEYFTRTIPSDHYQVKAMVEIVRRLGWSYVSIIYEESNYGIKAFEELESLLAKYDICIAVKEKLVKDSGVAEETAYDNIVFHLLTKPRARGAIIFGSDQEVAGLMRAVRRCNATGSFSWIGSDGWSARSLVWQGSEAEVEGTLSVQPQANPVRGFDSYFLNLTVENNNRNPWFVEFWEDHFQCRYPNSTRTPYNQRYVRTCSTMERLTSDNTAFENQLQFVSDAVMAFAVALRDMHSDLCHGRHGLCDSMRPTKGTELLKYLRRVNFQGLSGAKFHFDGNGDGPARYNIIHFKQISEGDYRWVRVGEYIEGELKLNMSEVQFKLNERQPPESVCSLPCDRGQAKKYVEGESCCWHCFNCTQYQIRHPLDETQCVMCREGTVPDSVKQECLEIPEVFLRVESAWAIGAMSLSATGMLVTLFVVGVFLRHNDTPVVKAAGRELSYVLLTGILLCYLVTFALVLRPTDVVCGIQRFGTGFCFTVVYAALFTKTNRISRIFNASKRTVKQLSFISPKSQLIICSCLVSIQVLINAVWMVVSPPRAIHHYPTREDNLLVCASYVNASYMIAFGYPIVLILVCTVYAVLTRNIPEAFNESKHIGFTMYTTCVIWLAFVPLYFGTGSHMPLRITSMSVTISLSASVTLVCLFSPKLYIILIRPERNVRQSMMPSRHGALKTGTTASVMVGAVPVTHTTQPFAQVLSQHENIALELNNKKPKSHKHHGPVQTATKSTQTQQLPSLSIKSPTAALVNNVVNNIASVVVSNGPPIYDMQH